MKTKPLYEVLVSNQPKKKIHKQNLTFREAQKEVRLLRKEKPEWSTFIYKQF